MLAAIAGVDADDIDDARVVEGEMHGNPPALAANANQIARSKPPARWRHARSKGCTRCSVQDLEGIRDDRRQTSQKLPCVVAVTCEFLAMSRREPAVRHISVRDRASLESVLVRGAGVRRRDGGSFRDPSGFVFVESGALYRQVNSCYRDDYDLLMSSGLAAELMERRLLVRHEEASLGEVHGEAYKLLRPERIPFISYPYEWCFGQLRDAALVTLKVQAHALKHGMSLKDASAYNVQFLDGKPVLIDTLSFERYVEGRPWVAYRQFCQHFLAPLALMAYGDVRFGRLSQIFIDGVPLDVASRLLPWSTRLKPSLSMHLHLHARMQTWHQDSTAPPAARRTPVLARAALTNLIENLANIVRGFRYTPHGTEWADYYANTNYSEASLTHKEQLVARLIERLRPTSVWDLGANTGRFSRLASSRGIRTIAFDVDPAAVERNYRLCVDAGETALLPLVLDLTNPSPNLGWAAEERQSLESRGPVDLVLALALVHHLAIGNNVPLSKVAEYLSRLATHLIIEFVPKADSQVQRMLATRADVFDRYTEAGFVEAFEQCFVIEQVDPIPDTSRTLYLMRRRDA
jgi:hypothetical protein